MKRARRRRVLRRGHCQPGGLCGQVAERVVWGESPAGSGFVAASFPLRRGEVHRANGALRPASSELASCVAVRVNKPCLPQEGKR